MGISYTISSQVPRSSKVWVGRGWDQKNNLVTFEIFVRMFIVELSMACVHVCSILGCQSLKESRKRTKAWTSSLGQFQEKAALCFDLRFEWPRWKIFSILFMKLVNGAAKQPTSIVSLSRCVKCKPEIVVFCWRKIAFPLLLFVRTQKPGSQWSCFAWTNAKLLE